jgi:hypothetical protein
MQKKGTSGREPKERESFSSKRKINEKKTQPAFKKSIN